MTTDIAKLCAVSDFIDPEKCDPWRLSAPALEAYLHNSARRLDVLKECFREIGYTPELQQFDYKGLPATNAIFSTGQDSDRQIWFVAHHDHRAALGAEDNGTALAAMLELARRFQGTEFERHLRFGSFDVEEMCCVGSFEYARRMNQNELDNIAFVIDLECLGSGPQIGVTKSVGAKKYQSDSELVGRILKTAAAHGFTNFAADDFDFFIADHVPFGERGLRTVGLYSLDHQSYKSNRGLYSNDRINLYGSVAHSVEDIPAKIQPKNLEDVVKVLHTVTREEFLADEERDFRKLTARAERLRKPLPLALLQPWAERNRKQSLSAAESAISRIEKRRAEGREMCT
jgi:hypothetical protein